MQEKRELIHSKIEKLSSEETTIKAILKLEIDWYNQMIADLKKFDY